MTNDRWATWLDRLPDLALRLLAGVLASWAGVQAAHDRWTQTAVVGVVALALMALGMRLRRRRLQRASAASPVAPDDSAVARGGQEAHVLRLDREADGHTRSQTELGDRERGHVGGEPDPARGVRREPHRP